MWNLFKAQLIAEYTSTTYNFADLVKVGRHGRYTENLYKLHFDISSGGRMVARPDIPKFFEAASMIYCSQNRFNFNATSNLLSSQLAIDHTYYWVARIIDSPLATIITIFPGIWTNAFFSPNFGYGARVWVDALSLSMYLQKTTVIGIRISKTPPFLVTPWSGFMFKSLDGGVTAASFMQSLSSVIQSQISLMSSIVYQGDSSKLNFMIDAYTDAYSSILTPELFDIANSIPNMYGVDFRNIDLTNPSSEADNIVLDKINNFSNDFISKF
jgi:hypothetical protein